MAGLRGPQIGLLLTTALVALLCLRVLPVELGVIAAFAISLTGTFATLVPVSGRTAEEWLPVIHAWAFRGLVGRRRYISSQPTAGPTYWDQPDFPPSLSNVEILSHTVPGSVSPIGVLKDRRRGTYTGVLSVRGKSFALLDRGDKGRRLSSWAGILSGLAREGGLVHRIQWVERTVPDPGDEIGEYLKDNIAVPLDSAIARSYLEVVDGAGPVTQEHEVFVALQIDAARAHRAIKAAGGGDFGANEVLRRELTALSASLVGSDIAVEGALTPRLVAHALRTAFEPGCRSRLASISSRDALREGTSAHNAGPMATEEEWGRYRTDGAWHATYWIAEWPRIDADPDFLAPLLLRTEAMRSVAVTMEPVSPLKAIRSIESARTSAAADEELRDRAGFMPTTRRRREQETLLDHERDLSDGHAFYRFAGFITVTTQNAEDLDAACGEIEEAAGRCLLDVRRLNGEQEMAFTYTLPLGRGLK